MQQELIFRIIFAFVLTAFVLHRRHTYQKHGATGNDAVVHAQRRGVELLSKVLGLAALLSGLSYVFYPRSVAWALLPIPVVLRWVGVGIAVLGFWLLQRSQQALGASWAGTPVLKKEQTLVTAGPYGRIRHPIYTSFLMILGALFPISANALVGSLWIGMVAVEVGSRVGVEEAMMTSRFGEPYQRYMATTGRILPRFFRGRKP